MSLPLVTSAHAPLADNVTHQNAALVDVVGRILIVLCEKLDRTTKQQIARRLLQRRRGRPRKRLRPELTIAQLCRLYQKHCAVQYPRRPGTRGNEVDSIACSLKPLRKLCSRLRVSQFSPRRLLEVRGAMVELGWCRKHVNHQIGRIKQMLKWAVQSELIPASVCHAIQAVQGLRFGECNVRESLPVKPVPEHLIEGVLQHTSSVVGAMIKLQLLTGMRPGEVCNMRTCDIDQDLQPWLYRPAQHKTQHHEHERNVFLGPQAQEVVRTFLNPDHPEAFLFSPAGADSERRALLHAARRTPMSCGNRPGTNRRARPKRTPGERYDTNSYCHAVFYAAQAAFPVPADLDDAQAKQWRRDHRWHPHQLRHNAATRLRKEHGIEVAQVVLGHKTLSVTQVYAEKDIETAQRAMLLAG